MKYCPKCGNRYPSENNFCLIDGTILVSNDPDAETLKIESARKVMPETEMISRKVRIVSGDYSELKTISGSIRVEVRDILEHEFATDMMPFVTKSGAAAQLKVDTGGGLIYGVSSTIKVDTNEYFVPVNASSSNQETALALLLLY